MIRRLLLPPTLAFQYYFINYGIALTHQAKLSWMYGYRTACVSRKSLKAIRVTIPVNSIIYTYPPHLPWRSRRRVGWTKFVEDGANLKRAIQYLSTRPDLELKTYRKPGNKAFMQRPESDLRRNNTGKMHHQIKPNSRWIVMPTKGSRQVIYRAGQALMSKKSYWIPAGYQSGGWWLSMCVGRGEVNRSRS